MSRGTELLRYASCNGAVLRGHTDRLKSRRRRRIGTAPQATRVHEPQSAIARVRTGLTKERTDTRKPSFPKRVAIRFPPVTQLDRNIQASAESSNSSCVVLCVVIQVVK